MKEGSASFFIKKEAKKFLFLRAVGLTWARGTRRCVKSFLVLFFKKELLSFLADG
jgi:hypothetical protein